MPVKIKLCDWMLFGRLYIGLQMKGAFVIVWLTYMYMFLSALPSNV